MFSAYLSQFRAICIKIRRVGKPVPLVEVTGLEPAASCSQSRHSSQTELHLVIDFFLLSFPALLALLQNRRLIRVAADARVAALPQAPFICHRQRSLSSPKAGTLAKLSYTSLLIFSFFHFLLCSPSCKIVASSASRLTLVLLRFLKLPSSATGSGRFRHPKQAL